MPLYTVIMKNGNTYQFRADSKESARRAAIRKAQHEELWTPNEPKKGNSAHTPASVRINK